MPPAAHKSAWAAAVSHSIVRPHIGGKYLLRPVASRQNFKDEPADTISLTVKLFKKASVSGERCDRLATTTSPSSGFGRTCISLAFDKVENNASMSSIILSSGAIYFSYALLSNVKNKRFNAGAYTMPLTGAPLSIKPIFTVKSVRLLINSLVPSSGSRRKNLSSIVSGKPFSELSSPII